MKLLLYCVLCLNCLPIVFAQKVADEDFSALDDIFEKTPEELEAEAKFKELESKWIDEVTKERHPQDPEHAWFYTLYRREKALLKKTRPSFFKNPAWPHLLALRTEELMIASPEELKGKKRDEEWAYRAFEFHRTTKSNLGGAGELYRELPMKPVTMSGPDSVGERSIRPKSRTEGAASGSAGASGIQGAKGFSK